MLWYLPGQFLGSMLGAGFVYAVFNPLVWRLETVMAITRGDPQSIVTAGIYINYAGSEAFNIYPSNYFNLVGWFWLAFGVEIIATGIFMFVLVALQDSNQKLTAQLKTAAPLVIGVAFAAAVGFAAPIDGGCLNPFRDLGPRLIVLMGGYKSIAFPGKSGGEFYVYLTGPLLGAIAGVFLYDYTIGAGHAKRNKVEQE
eukprot:GHVN01023407.1.p1 GENE.GHVN01023407.1~~GHVN01023407.1.p1  ORF type:complete len:198 (+),score=7.20 GHVN01023407.1:112-705(+)